MEKIKSFKYFIITLVLLGIVFGILFYINNIKSQNYNYKGFFVKEISRGVNNGYIYKNS